MLMLLLLPLRSHSPGTLGAAAQTINKLQISQNSTAASDRKRSKTRAHERLALLDAVTSQNEVRANTRVGRSDLMVQRTR
uniref:Putative secreted protein n=1 Tax=Anopheles marajoara TaxID=58244 RepID=A0A2M4CBM9_9DIPT